MNRDEAFVLLKKNVLNENLIKHCVAVEAIMKKLAEYFKEDVNRWSQVGLLHDIDYESTKDSPEKHGLVAMDILKPYEIDQESLKAIKSHNEMSGFSRETLMAKTLFCVDQLSGLIVASTLVLPSKKINDLTLDSVLKKFKEKSFAKGAKRENILLCESDLNIKLNDLVLMALEAMQDVSEAIGL